MKICKGLGSVAFAFAVFAACSAPTVEAIEPTLTEMAASYEQLGLSATVADCVVGLSERRDMPRLDPENEQDAATKLIIEEFVASCVTADALVNPAEEPPERLALSDEPFTLGDDQELDLLWTSCEVGDGRSCDLLWEVAPVGSSYEEFGVTCGHRPELLNCTEELWVDTEEGIENDKTQTAG